MTRALYYQASPACFFFAPHAGEIRFYYKLANYGELHEEMILFEKDSVMFSNVI